MDAELFICDVGNTALKVGLANEKRIVSSFVFPTPSGETGDGLGLRFSQLLRSVGAAREDLRACVVCSVSPQADGIVSRAAEDWLRCPCLFAPGDLPIPLENRYSRPAEVGADRLTAAYAARELFPDAAELIVVDYGTAVTFDRVSGDSYLGGYIFPGLKVAMSALAGAAAKLSTVDLSAAPCDFAPGRDTESSVRKGLLFGYAALTEGLIERLARGVSPKPVVILAGGAARLMGDLLDGPRNVVPDLALEGLRRLYYARKRSGR